MPPSHAPAASALLDALLARRLIVVTGKGGTGKTTLAAALGLAAARLGKATLLVEMGGASGLARALHAQGSGYRQVRVGERLHLLSMGPKAALEDYIVRQVKLRALYRLVFRNRWMGPFMDAVPGLGDIIQLGKIWDLCQEREEDGWRWDVLILDAPATGHGLSLLGAPSAMMDLTRSGPFHANAAKVQALISDPLQTAVVLTALPEPLPVNEALQLARGLGSCRKLLRGCVLNQVHPPPFTPLEAWPTARARLAEIDDPAWRDATGLMDHWVAQARRQVEARGRLDRELGLPRLELPALASRSLSRDDLDALAACLLAGGGAAP